MSAQQLATQGNPALGAVAPRSDMWDLYSDLLLPGGVYNEFFSTTWSDITEALDRHTVYTFAGDTWVLPAVAGDEGGALRDMAVAGHPGNLGRA